MKKPMKQYTQNEYRAWLILHTSLTTEPIDFHAYGNKIIALAEQIKAERAVLAMQEKD